MKLRLLVSVAAKISLLMLSAGWMAAHAQSKVPGNKAEPWKAVASNDELQQLYSQSVWARIPTPRAPDGHPDLSGFWYNDLGNAGTRSENGSVSFALGGARDRSRPPRKYPEPNNPSYKPEYAAKVKAIVDSQYGPTSAEDPVLDCKPMGVPRVATGPLQIVQTPKMVVILYESNFIGGTFRIIYTDGRMHPAPADLDPSYLGDSIGHWEGDVLVVDVVGLNEETWLGGAQGHTEPGLEPGEGNHQITEKYALIHSDQEHVIERYTRRGNMLFYEATVEDPVMFTKPWVLTPRHLLPGGPNDRLMETVCDSKDKSHIVQPTATDPGK